MDRASASCLNIASEDVFLDRTVMTFGDDGAATHLPVFLEDIRLNIVNERASASTNLDML